MSPRLDPDALFHLATPAEWERYQGQDLIAPGSLGSEGFVHCSWGRQVSATVIRHFAGVEELLALRLDPDGVGTPVVEEDSTGSGQRFPHLYGPVPVEAVQEVVELVPAALTEDPSGADGIP